MLWGRPKLNIFWKGSFLSPKPVYSKARYRDEIGHGNNSQTATWANAVRKGIMLVGVTTGQIRVFKVRNNDRYVLTWPGRPNRDVAYRFRPTSPIKMTTSNSVTPPN